MCLQNKILNNNSLEAIKSQWVSLTAPGLLGFSDEFLHSKLFGKEAKNMTKKDHDSGKGPKYWVDIEGDIKPWEDNTITTFCFNGLL